jgi:predicted HicB family RNase H-like nuclease
MDGEARAFQAPHLVERIYIPELHRQLALEAAESGVSLNRLAIDKLRGNAAKRISANKTVVVIF